MNFKLQVSNIPRAYSPLTSIVSDSKLNQQFAHRPTSMFVFANVCFQEIRLFYKKHIHKKHVIEIRQKLRNI